MKCAAADNRTDPMAPPPLVSVIVPAYRQPSVCDCLESLRLLEADGVGFDVHVVLNDVPPEIRRLVLEFEGLPIVVHDCPVNLGTGRSYNLAFSESAAPFMLGLQDDAVVEAGLLRTLVERIEQTPDIGAASALVTDLDGRTWDAGWVIWGDGTASPRWAGVDRNPAAFADTRAVAHHGTMGTLIRREAWQSIGGFDGAFYPVMYGDVDASIAMRRRGWRIVVEPLARARQAVNASTTVPYRDFLVARHHARLMEKHGDWIAQAPPRSDDPAAVAREADRVAATPVGLAPEPPTTAELALLESRLAWTREEMLRLERDLLADYRRHLEAALAEKDALLAANHNERERLLEAAEREHAGRDAAERAAWQARGDVDRALAERDAVHAELEAIALSRTWRAASAVRRLARRF